jgi:ABC-type methionine transport system permease subunit
MLIHREHFIIWILLVALIGLGAFVAETSQGKMASIIILCVTFMKFISVGFYFMETRKSHLFWKGMLVFTVAIFIFTYLVIR